jgi:protein-S-isoprenylcysteine O-methyltransferase Ste14
LLPLVLFLAAGRLDWVMGWVCVGLNIGFAVGSRLISLRRHPELLVERAHSLEAEDIQSWDRLLLILLGVIGPLVTWLVAGLDRRFGWSPDIPLSLQLVALVLMLLGCIWSTWAMAVNEFFSAIVRIQQDRRQKVISAGPYRFMRHPGYAGAIVAYAATPVMLGSLWTLLPAGGIIVGVVIRTFLEDRLLCEGLTGYAEYMRQVPFRLCPGIW